MTAFAYYRLPYLHHAHYVVQHEGEPEVLSSVAELEWQQDTEKKYLMNLQKKFLKKE